MSETAISLDSLSYTSFYVECFFDDTFLANGTCFFVKRNDSDYLITNWHIVSGQNNETKEYLDKVHGAIPNNLRVHIFKKQELVERVVLRIDIRNKDDFPMWLEHPVFQEKVDVIAMKATIPEDMDVAYVEDMMEPFNESTKAGIKDDVYVLGFPFGITEGEGFPIWKRASIASEPILDIQNRPLMYIDTASRAGMSGSPVIYKERRGVALLNGEPGKEGTKISHYFMEFIGVYSGRIGADDEFKAQLGRVWKKTVIDEIINQKVIDDKI